MSFSKQERGTRIIRVLVKKGATNRAIFVTPSRRISLASGEGSAKKEGYYRMGIGKREEGCEKKAEIWEEKKGPEYRMQ